MTRRSRVLALIAAACAAGAAAAVLSGGRVAAAPSATVWLCRPGAGADPCATSRAATVIAADGTHAAPRVLPATERSRFDCFYVYPTVSSESSVNADLHIQPAEVAVAQAQASRFSQVCRVWAPMYRQETLGALLVPGQTSRAVGVAYGSLLSAWRDYLAHDNDGRPIVFIGHSQGAAMLIRLLESQIDPSRALRARLVSAIILGGNVDVPSGRRVGGTFRNIPACGSISQTSCVIAYSSFPGRPPVDSLFGIPGQGVSIQSGQTARQGVSVLCVNPAALGGGTAALEPYFPTAQAKLAGIATPWVAFPHLYTASCRHAGEATWLQVTDVGGRSDHRPRLGEPEGQAWGYHSDDVNVALGNLGADVGAQETSYLHSHGR
jgi:Protein of unknown function (DUF3089)